MKLLEKKSRLLILTALLILSALMLPVFATIYVDPTINHDNPPNSNIVLEDAFTTASSADSYVHPVNHQQVVVTEDEEYQAGAIWYKYPIDLNYDFSFEMYIYLGNKDQASRGADGMTFTMHNDSRGTEAMGAAGAGLGAYNGNHIQKPCLLKWIPI